MKNNQKTSNPKIWKTRANTPSVFGDARDEYRRDRGFRDVNNPCTSKGLSTMPRRERGPQNKSGYVPA